MRSPRHTLPDCLEPTNEECTKQYEMQGGAAWFCWLILTDRQRGRNPYPSDGAWAAETMTQSYDTGKQAMVELGAKQPHELLLMLGGVLAILLSVAIYGIQAANQGIPQSQYGAVATTIVINVVLGGALWASAAITRKKLMNGAIVAGGGRPAPVFFPGPHRTRVGGVGGLVA